LCRSNGLHGNGRHGPAAHPRNELRFCIVKIKITATKDTNTLPQFRRNSWRQRHTNVVVITFFLH
jgi:hypothetical protein